VLAPQYKPENAEFAEKNGSFRFLALCIATRTVVNMPILPAFLTLNSDPTLPPSLPLDLQQQEL
jgi:hypothetical protein